MLSLVFLFGSTINAYAGSVNRAYRLNKDGLGALNKGDYTLAVRYFELALTETPNNITIRYNLATAYNDWGLSLAKKEDLDKAIECLKHALSLQPTVPLYRENLSGVITQKAYKFHQEKEIKKCEELLKKALEYNLSNFNALSLLGDISYCNQKMQEAKSYWEKALIISPESEFIKEKLSKLNKEYPLEKKLKELDSFNFGIRYVQGEDTENNAYEIKEYLLDAYRQVGNDFDYFPGYKIMVLIYPEEDFEKIKNKSPFITGIYDGKIRLSAKKDTKELPEKELKKLIFHEYTHLVVNDLGSGNCPIWLNEGLAKYEESKAGKVEFQYLNKENIIPLKLLSDAFQSPNEKDITLAYEQSFSIVTYIINRSNLYTVTKILEELKKEKFEDVLQKYLYLNLEKLEKRWKEDGIH